MSEQVWTPRMTVSAVIERGGRFLLVEEKDEEGKRVFNQPAGHMEDQENLIQAAEREVLEETGYEFTAVSFSGLYQWHAAKASLTFMRVNFIGTVGTNPVSDKLDSDITAVHWLTPEEIALLPLRSPLVLRCIEDYLHRPHYPLDALIEQT